MPAGRRPGRTVLRRRGGRTGSSGAVAGVPSGDLGQTPGSYAYDGFDQPTVDNLHWTQKITTDPGQANVFWSNQFAFDNGWTGYTGFQTHRDGIGMLSEDASGRSCWLDASPIPGHSYRWDVSSDTAGWYTFKITDETAKTSTITNPITATCLRAEDNAVGAKISLATCNPAQTNPQWTTPARMVR